MYFNFTTFSNDLLATVFHFVLFHVLLMRLYIAYFDQKQTLNCTETRIKLVGLTVLFVIFIHTFPSAFILMFLLLIFLSCSYR
jgi:hypothetical protein